MSTQGAFAPTTPLYARQTQGQAQAVSGAGADASSHQTWGGFPQQNPSHSHQPQQMQQRLAPASNAQTGALSLARSVPQQQPITPGLTRSGSGFFNPNQQPISQSSSLQLQAPSSSLALSTASKPASTFGQLQLARGGTQSSAVVPAKTPSKSPPKMSAASAAEGPTAGAIEQSFTRAALVTRIQWNALALAGLFVLPNFGPVRGAMDIAFGVLSVSSAGLLDSAVDSLAEYAVMLAKVMIVINLLDAVARLQSKAVEEKSAAGKIASTATPGKGTPAAKLALGVRSSPQTRPSASHLMGTSSPSSSPSAKVNSRRTPLYLQPGVRAALDEASLLATPTRPSPAEPEAHGSSSSPFRASGGLGGASGRRWPSGSPAASLAAQNGESRNISPVQIFQARRAASGRGRMASGLQFDSSFDDDDDGSTEAPEVKYGLKVLNSSFSADWPPSSGPASSFATARQ
ncbi:hypothetical protein CF326_g4666 [Tilletia indica]|nr:hypothetical protein CF326_g4666 [Tilletia indica]